MKKKQELVIAFDGFSACGKSTIAKALAKKLNYIYIDSGAMYRAVTLLALRKKIINDQIINEEELSSFLDDVKISFRFDETTEKQETYLHTENVEQEIRGLEVSNHVSRISELKKVRQVLVRLQQDLGKNRAIVMDGRDIGTAVFPNADLKIFVTAEVDIRTKRRYDELIEKGVNASFEEVKNNIQSRDFIDQNRKLSPLRKADDAIVLDNSNMTREEQLEWVMKIIRSKFEIDV